MTTLRTTEDSLMARRSLSSPDPVTHVRQWAIRIALLLIGLSLMARALPATGPEPTTAPMLSAIAR